MNRRKDNLVSIEIRVAELVLAAQNGRLRPGELIGYSSRWERIDAPAVCFITRIHREASTGEFVVTLRSSSNGAALVNARTSR